MASADADGQHDGVGLSFPTNHGSLYKRDRAAGTIHRHPFRSRAGVELGSGVLTTFIAPARAFSRMGVVHLSSSHSAHTADSTRELPHRIITVHCIAGQARSPCAARMGLRDETGRDRTGNIHRFLSVEAELSKVCETFRQVVGMCVRSGRADKVCAMRSDRRAASGR